MNKQNAGFKPPGPEVDGAAMSVLMEHRRGEVLSELSQALREVTEAVALVGKSGTVTLKIKVAPAQGTSDTLVISDDIKTTVPKLAKGGTIFYPDDNNNLVRNDPNQHDLPLQIVDTQRQPRPAVPVVDIAAKTEQQPVATVDLAAK